MSDIDHGLELKSPHNALLLVPKLDEKPHRVFSHVHHIRVKLLG
jgi:hypothetical protein